MMARPERRKPGGNRANAQTKLTNAAILGDHVAASKAAGERGLRLVGGGNHG